MYVIIEIQKLSNVFLNNKIKKIAVLFNLSDGLNRINCSDKYPFGGANGARTRHLIHAMDALSQMSYCPIHKKILQYIKKIINQKLHLNKQRCSLNGSIKIFRVTKKL